MKKKGKIKKIIKTLFALAFVGSIIWIMTVRINGGASTNDYDFTIPYEKQKLSRFITANGKVSMTDKLVMTSDVEQKIKKINCKVGDKIKEGDVVCEFETGDIEEQIVKLEKIISDFEKINNLQIENLDGNVAYVSEKNKIALQNAQLELESAKKAYEIANAKTEDYYKKYYNATDENLANEFYKTYEEYNKSLSELQQKIDTSQQNYEIARFESENDVQSAEDQKKSFEYQNKENENYKEQLEKLRKQKENLVVKATKSGVITEIYANEGSYLMNGELLQIGTLNDYVIDASIYSQDILKIKTGMNVSFTTKLTGAKEIKGTVKSISDVYDGMGYGAQIEIQDKEYMELLKPDINTAVKVFLQDEIEAFAVSYDSIFSDDDGEKYVFVAEKKGKNNYEAKKVKIETGLETDYYIEIKSSSLKEGDLIVGDAQKYNEGEKIKIKGMTE